MIFGKGNRSTLIHDDDDDDDDDYDVNNLTGET
jgi:hypothetical protein